jgi:hypothetical protein
MIGNDRADYVGSVGPDGNLIAAPQPVRRAAQPPPPYGKKPYPAQWPDHTAFTRAWELQEELTQLRAESRAAEEGSSSTGLTVIADDNESLSKDGRRQLEKRERAASALRSFDHEALERALYNAGAETIKTIRAANSLRDELERAALAIFSVRVDGLGLNEHHIRRIFSGSAIGIKYAKPALYTGQMCSAGSAEYMDEPLDAMVCRLRSARIAKAEYAALLNEAKAELDSTSRAAKSASKIAV